MKFMNKSVFTIGLLALLFVVPAFGGTLNKSIHIADGASSGSTEQESSAPPPPADERERSEYEENLEQEADGPTTPELGDGGLPGEGENGSLPPLDEQEDFFAE